MSNITNLDKIKDFLIGYGLNPQDPVIKAELFGNLQESIQFVKRYFLREGNSDGLDLNIPPSILGVVDIESFFLMATFHSDSNEQKREEALWAEIILKIMHIILHIDKDLRGEYFNDIQMQVFDKFYKHIVREEEKLFLGNAGEEKIEIFNFETKSKKSRDSIILKLLHKSDSVSEELFDRIGVRIVTKNRFDILRVLRYLVEENVVVPHNIKSSRSFNTIFNLEKFNDSYMPFLKEALEKNLTEEEFLEKAEEMVRDCPVEDKESRNSSSLDKYQSIQFTGRCLIIHKSPLFKDINKVKAMAKNRQIEKFQRKFYLLIHQ